MKKTIMGAMVAGAMTASLVLFGCGGTGTQSTAQSAASTAQSTESAQSTAQSTSTQQTPASTTTDSAATTTNTTTTNTSTTTPAATEITPEEAMQIALTDAGLSQNDVTGLKAERDIDDAVPHYDVDFRQGNVEYDYDIDLATGAILSRSSEVDD